jgi:hypothetical protein
MSVDTGQEVLQVGDKVYLGSTNALAHWYGIITDGEVPSSVTATMEWGGENAVLSLAALVGPQGVPGQSAPIVKMQYGSAIDDPADLPQNLTDDPIDIGKAWWIANEVYLWSGDPDIGVNGYVVKQMGTAGPPGPVPNITPAIELIDPDDADNSEIVRSGTSLNPGWLFRIKAPAGPAGPAGPIRDAEDYDDTTAPDNGDVIAWNGVKYAPTSLDLFTPRFYSIPESAFSNTSGLSTRITIGSFQIPPQPFDWVPYIFGHVKAFGVELDEDPFTIGCEVRMGDAMAGTLVARGFGNIASWAHIMPHFSQPSSGATAVTPDNGYAVVPANHAGDEGTVNCNLFNDGLAGLYMFNKSNAQLSCMCIPV